MNKKISNQVPKSMGLKKVSNIKVSSIEKEYGLKLKRTKPNMNLSTYMEKSGLPEMARVLRTVEKEINTKR